MSSILFAVNMYRPLGHVRFHINCPQLVQRFCRGQRWPEQAKGELQPRELKRCRWGMGLIRQQRPQRERRELRKASLTISLFFVF